MGQAATKLQELLKVTQDQLAKERETVKKLKEQLHETVLAGSTRRSQALIQAGKWGGLKWEQWGTHCHNPPGWLLAAPGTALDGGHDPSLPRREDVARLRNALLLNLESPPSN